MLLFRSLNKKIGYYGQDKIIKTTIKSLLSSLIMGAVSYYSYHYMMKFTHIGGKGEFIVLSIAVAFGAVIYTGLVTLLRIDEINIVTDVVKKRLGKK